MPPAPGAQDAVKTRRVLVVDDDREFAEGLELLLTTENYDVGLAHSAAAAKEAIGGFTPEVALIDIRLAGSSGINLISELHDKRPDIVCVMITAFASTDTAIEAIHAGAYDYLCKPFHSSDLFATLDRCFERILLAHEKAMAEAALLVRNEELEQINKRLKLVVRSMQGLAHYSTIREICPRVLVEVARNMAADGGSVYLREGDQLVLKHALDPGHAPRTISLPLSGESVFGSALERNGPVLLSEIDAGRDLLPSGWSGYGDRSLLAFPLLGDDGEEIGVLSLHAKRDPPFTKQDRDIGLILISFICETIRAVQALEDLAKSEERFRSLVENSPFWIHEMDLSGRLLAMNKAGIEMVGMSEADDIAGMDYLEFVAPAHRERVADLFCNARAGGVCHFEFEMGQNGSSRTFASCFAPLRDPDGAVQKIMGITRDVTERKRAAEQLLQAQKMEAVGQLTGGVAHDFNNLLSVILGNVGLIEEDLADGAVTKFSLNAMRRAVLRGGELTQRLLAFSRQQPLRPKVTDLSVLVNGMKDMLRRTLGETIRIETVARADLRRTLADPGQVENALLNLAINARDAMPDGGKLTISVGNATPEEASAAERHGADAGKFVVLSVDDTGKGMASEVLERVFEPFFTTKGVGKGSGLGLSMIYGFVQQSGGYVTIESAPGQGTMVRIFLPQAEAGAVDLEPVAITEEPRGRNEIILVVEDDVDVRNLTVSLLERMGYAVLAAEDGIGALTVLETTPRVDLLLTDAVLPGGISGPQFIKEAKRRHGEIKALLMSGYSLRFIEQHGGLDAGVALINKPFERYDLAQKLRDVLEPGRA